MLRPGGRLCLVWNQRDEQIPWVRRLGALIGTQEQLRDPREVLERRELFGVDEESIPPWQIVDRYSIQDLVRSRSNVAVLDAGRAGRPSWPRCSRSTTTTAGAWTACSCPTPRPASAPTVLDRVTPTLTTNGPTEDAENVANAVSDGSSTDMLLIDFR